MIEHNKIDSTVMSRITGLRVGKHDFHLEEDRSRPLATGVTWRRRRFRFRVITSDGPDASDRPEGLCINEVTLDSQSSGTLRAVAASEFPHLVDFKEIENAFWATTFAKGAIRTASGQRETRLFLNLAPLVYGKPSAKARELIHHLQRFQQRNAASDALLAPLDVFDPNLVEQPGGGFGIVRYLPAFPASRLVQASANILAATNAGYFLNFPEEYDDGISALHQPLGGHIIDGRLVLPPWVSRPGLVGLRDGTIQSGIFGPADIVLEIEGLPAVPLKPGIDGGTPHGMVWRSFDPEPPVPPSDAVLLSFSAGVMVSAEPARAGAKPPHGGGILWITGEHARAALAPGAEKRITLRLRPQPGAATEPDWMVSAGPFLVHGGRTVSQEEMLQPRFAGEFRPNGPAPTRFPFDTDKTAAPRTAMGVTPAGGLKLVVVDGRRSGEHSCGLTLRGMSELMQWVGCESAINLDGGGSSVMAIEGATPADALLESGPYNVVNIPSDDGGKERTVPLFLTIVKKT